jgi:hypothetical protein
MTPASGALWINGASAGIAESLPELGQLLDHVEKLSAVVAV